MQAGGYTLDLYCDAESPEHKYGEFPHQFFEEHGSTCRAKARRAGWRLARTPGGQDLCPKCSGKERRQTRT